MNSVRRILYALASLLGDINAIRRGRYGRRLLRKSLAKASGKVSRRLIP